MQDQAHIHGALIVLRCLARKYEFKDEEERQPLAAMVNSTFPTLMQTFLVRPHPSAINHIHCDPGRT